MSKLLLIFVFFSVIARADDDFGYILYAQKPNQVGSVLFKADDAIFVKTSLKSVKRKRRGGFTAIVDFKRADLGQPKGEWQQGRMDFSKWKRPTPLSQQDPAIWTTEPAHSQEMGELPKELCPSGDARCKDVARLIYEFHNNELCDQVNRTAAIAESRTVQLLKSWNAFIKEKSKGKCRVGPPAKNKLCEQLKRARDVDILARTAIFESEPAASTRKKAVARHECEENVIMLAIRNTAFSHRCKKRQNRKTSAFRPLHGCAFSGDFTGAATKPDEINIWLPDAALATRITGCFLRSDAESAEWKKSDTMPNPDRSKAAFLGRRRDYINILERAYRFTDPNEKMDSWFDIDMDGKTLSMQDKQRLINETKLYYHPIGMAKCDPKVYNQTNYISLAFATKGKNTYLLSGTRFIPTEKPKKSAAFTIASIYTMELRGDRLGSDASWDQYFKGLTGAKVEHRFVDQDRANVCWPTPKSTCALDKKLDYRKAPIWATNPNNEKYHFACRSRKTRNDRTWTWNGICDSGMVVVPEAHFK